jgi:hypothetical protein
MRTCPYNAGFRGALQFAQSERGSDPVDAKATVSTALTHGMRRVSPLPGSPLLAVVFN